MFDAPAYYILLSPLMVTYSEIFHMNAFIRASTCGRLHLCDRQLG